MWDGRVNIPRDGKYRKAGSIEIRSGFSSTIKYIIPMVANESGYTSTFDIDLKDITTTSSVNDSTLLQAKSVAVSIALNCMFVCLKLSYRFMDVFPPRFSGIKRENGSFKYLLNSRRCTSFAII